MIGLLKRLFTHPRYEVFKSEHDDQYYFRLVARNGEIILHSEGYKSHGGAMNGIKSTSENGTHSDNYEERISQNYLPYFVLKAQNGEIIGSSEVYTTYPSMRKGIRSVIKNCSTLRIERV